MFPLKSSYLKINHIVALRQRFLIYLFAGRVQQISSKFVFTVGIDIAIEDSQTVNVANVGGNLSQSLDLFLVGNSFLEYSLTLTLQLAEHVQDKLLEILYLQLSLLAQLFNVVLYNILSLHIHLVHLSIGE